MHTIELHHSYYRVLPLEPYLPHPRFYCFVIYIPCIIQLSVIIQENHYQFANHPKGTVITNETPLVFFYICHF